VQGGGGRGGRRTAVCRGAGARKRGGERGGGKSGGVVEGEGSRGVAVRGFAAGRRLVRCRVVDGRRVMVLIERRLERAAVLALEGARQVADVVLLPILERARRRRHERRPEDRAQPVSDVVRARQSRGVEHWRVLARASVDREVETERLEPADARRRTRARCAARSRRRDEARRRRQGPAPRREEVVVLDEERGEGGSRGGRGSQHGGASARLDRRRLCAAGSYREVSVASKSS